jgi:hypothetical protein
MTYGCLTTQHLTNSLDIDGDTRTPGCVRGVGDIAPGQREAFVGTLSSTLPTCFTVRLPSSATSSHFEPGFQSDRFSCFQYWRVNSPSRRAFQTFCGVVTRGLP